MKSICKLDGCEREVLVKELCSIHYRRLMRTGEYGPVESLRRDTKGKCKVEGCEDIAEKRPGYCGMHFMRLKRKGEYGSPSPIMSKKGSGSVCKRKGYRYITKVGHPNANSLDGRIAEHRWVVSDYLGRPLLPNENVHHKNGDKLDNRIENLELWITLQPAGQRIPDLIQYAKELLSTYEPSSLAPNQDFHPTDLCFLA